MGKEEEIIRKLRSICKIDTDFSFVCEVKENYPDDELVDVVALDGTEYNDVRKKSGVDGKKGILLTPIKNSFVIVSRIENSNDLFISKYGELHSIKIDMFDKQIIISESQIYLKSNSQELKITNEGIVMNGGEFGGVIKSETLASEINELKSDINALKQAFVAWIVVAQDGGSALKAATATWANQQLASVTKSVFENDKVKH